MQNGIRVNLGATYIDSFIDQNDLKKIPYLTEKFQGVWKVEKKWKSSNVTFDLTGSVIGTLRLPTLGALDPRPSYSPAFHIINIQLTKSWNNIFETYCGIKNLLDFTPSAESIARSFDPFDNGVSFDVEGNALSTQNNPFALTFDPSYVYASNQGIRFFFGLRLKLN
jgi:outer membrane receptor for ferrienterochelin and colicins